MRKPVFFICENKTRISCEVTAQLISAFVFAAWIVRFLFSLNPTFQASRNLLWLYSPVLSDLVGNPENRFFHNEAHFILNYCLLDFLRNVHGKQLRSCRDVK